MKLWAPRGMELAYAGVALAAAGATVGGAYSLGGRDAQPAIVRVGPALRAYATLPHREAFFGDDIPVRIEIVADRRRVDLTRVRVAVRFAPFVVAGQSHSDESLGSGFQRRIYTYRLRCLVPGCLPPASAYRLFRFPPARVSVPGRPGVQAPWPPLAVVSRTVTGSSLRVEGLRAAAAVPASSRSRSVLLWSSAPLAAIGLVLAAWWVKRRFQRRAVAAHLPAEVVADPVAVACAGVRTRLAGRVRARQRGALDLLARALADADEPELARSTSHLAWRRGLATEQEVIRLLEDVEHRGAETGA